MPPLQRRCHRACGNDKRLGDIPLKEQSQDHRHRQRFDSLPPSAVVRLGLVLAILRLGWPGLVIVRTLGHRKTCQLKTRRRFTWKQPDKNLFVRRGLNIAKLVNRGNLNLRHVNSPANRPACFKSHSKAGRLSLVPAILNVHFRPSQKPQPTTLQSLTGFMPGNIARIYHTYCSFHSCLLQAYCTVIASYCSHIARYSCLLQRYHSSIRTYRRPFAAHSSTADCQAQRAASPKRPQQPPTGRHPRSNISISLPHEPPALVAN